MVGQCVFWCGALLVLGTKRHTNLTKPEQDPELNVIIVTHGLTLRLLVMRWFQYSISDFEESINPPNGGVVSACVYICVCRFAKAARRRTCAPHDPI